MICSEMIGSNALYAAPRGGREAGADALIIVLLAMVRTREVVRESMVGGLRGWMFDGIGQGFVGWGSLVMC